MLIAFLRVPIGIVLRMINPPYLQEVSVVKYTLNAENILDPSCVAPLIGSRLDCIIPGVKSPLVWDFSSFNH